MLPPCLGSLLRQDYPGAFAIVLVDDESSDGTADVVWRVTAGAERRLTVVQGRPLPAGWTGKVWAMQQGIAQAETEMPPPDYLLLTDADIAYAPDVLRRLVSRAEAEHRVLVSLRSSVARASPSGR